MCAEKKNCLFFYCLSMALPHDTLLQICYALKILYCIITKFPFARPIFSNLYSYINSIHPNYDLYPSQFENWSATGRVIFCSFLSLIWPRKSNFLLLFLELYNGAIFRWWTLHNSHAHNTGTPSSEWGLIV